MDGFYIYLLCEWEVVEMLDTEMDKGPLAELVILYKSGFQDKHFISYFSIKKNNNKNQHIFCNLIWIISSRWSYW